MQIIRLIFLFPFSLIISCSQIAFAQNSWTLEDCILKAWDNNLTIKQQELNLELSEAHLLQSKLSLLPNLNAGINGAMNFGRSVDPTTYEFVTQTIQTSSASLTSSWTLFSGFRKWNFIKQNQFDLKASQLDLQKAKESIALTVTSYYLLVLFGYEEEEIASQQFDLIQLQYERMDKLVKSGSLPEGSLLEIDAQRKRDELTLINAQNNLQSALLNLKLLLDLESNTTIEIVRPDLPDPDTKLVYLLDPAAIYQTAITTKPQIGSSEFRLQSAEKGLAIARGAHSPSISFFANLSTNYADIAKRISNIYPLEDGQIGYVENDTSLHVLAPQFGFDFEEVPFADQLEDNFSRAIGVSMNIPIFNNWQTNGQVRQAKLNYLNAQYSVDIQKQELMKDIQQAYSDAVAAAETYKATQSSMNAIDKSFYYTEQRFNAGLVNAYEYNLAKQNLSVAESQLLRAKYDFIFKMKVLDFYQGYQINLN